MFRKIHSLNWIGLTLTMGMVACHFPQSPALAQINPSSANNEDKTIREKIFQTELEPHSYTSSLADRSSSHREYNPPVMCNFPIIKNILPWKCPEPSTANITNSPKSQNTNSQQNLPPASTIQPTKK